MSLRFPLVPCNQVGLPRFADRIRSYDLSWVQAVGNVAATIGGAIGARGGGVGGSAGAVAGALIGLSSGIQYGTGESGVSSHRLCDFGGKVQQDAGQIEGRMSAMLKGSKGHNGIEFGVAGSQQEARDEAGAELQNGGACGELSEKELAIVAERVYQELEDPYGDIVPAAALSKVYAPRKHIGLERQFGFLAGRMIAPEVLEVGDDAWYGFAGIVWRGW